MTHDAIDISLGISSIFHGVIGSPGREATATGVFVAAASL